MRLIRNVLVLLAFTSSVAQAATDDSMNFRFGPLHLLAGQIYAEFDFVLNENLTLGPILRAAAAEDDVISNSTIYKREASVGAFGARANYYFAGVNNDGWYLSPSLSTARVNVKLTDSTGASAETDANGILMGLTAGYHWYWESFNLSFGGGILTFTGPDNVDVRHSNGTTTRVETRGSGGSAFDLDFLIGWTF